MASATNSTDLSPPPPDSSPPPPATSSPPPPADASPPPPATSSPPPPADSSPPPPATSSPPPPADSSPPPPASASPPPPADSSPPPPASASPPPPGNSSPPPPQNSNSPPPPSPTKSPPSPKPPPPPHNDNDKGKWSPPPPSMSRSPPSPRPIGPPSKPKSNNDTNNRHGNHLVPILVGVAVGVGVLLVIIIVVSLFACRKKKKKLAQSDYFTEKPPANNNGGAFYVPSQQPNNWGPPNNWQNSATSPPQTSHWQNPAQPQLNGNLPPPPGGIGNRVWAPPTPTAAPPLNNSSVFVSSEPSTASYSGPHGPILPPPPPPVAFGFSKSSFTYDELAVATGGFSQANLLGQGGFGYVHKGVLPNGKEIAVKCLKDGSGQGNREFQAEVDIISRVHHRHLVSLVGYCIAGAQRLLVYEFVPNSTLEYHLHGKGCPTMDWSTRVKIALGAAKGLAYLHEDCHPRIIHRDIKAANILIDENFEAKVADFGLAKLNSDTNTHVSTRVMGTFGYMAPEYASSGKLTDKSDVFSFGVMLLELITGRRPVDISGEMEDSLVDWARPLCERALVDRNYDILADPALEGNYDTHEMAFMIACAGAAVSHSARRRPKMGQIVRALEGDISVEHLNELKAGEVSGASSSDHDNPSYSADMRKFRKALDSREYASSEYGHTSEYGLNPSSSSSEDMSGVRSHRPAP